jgi:hypothetical protein
MPHLSHLTFLGVVLPVVGNSIYGIGPIENRTIVIPLYLFANRYLAAYYIRLPKVYTPHPSSSID